MPVWKQPMFTAQCDHRKLFTYELMNTVCDNLKMFLHKFINGLIQHIRLLYHSIPMQLKSFISCQKAIRQFCMNIKEIILNIMRTVYNAKTTQEVHIGYLGKNSFMKKKINLTSPQASWIDLVNNFHAANFNKKYWANWTT